jgi:hypothetical protein
MIEHDCRHTERHPRRPESNPRNVESLAIALQDEQIAQHLFEREGKTNDQEGAQNQKKLETDKKRDLQTGA